MAKLSSGLIEPPPNPDFQPVWLKLPAGKFYATIAYVQGALAVQRGTPYANPYKPGPAYAQYGYGWGNEKVGFHDNLDLPVLTE